MNKVGEFLFEDEVIITSLSIAGDFQMLKSSLRWV